MKFHWELWLASSDGITTRRPVMTEKLVFHLKMPVMVVDESSRHFIAILKIKSEENVNTVV